MSSFNERFEKSRRSGLIAHRIDMVNLDREVYARSQMQADDLADIASRLPIERDP